MGNKMTLQDTIDLATFAHRHQFDKAGEPYIKHPLRVLKSVQDQGARAFVQMAAVLHDLTEDQPFTPQMLLDLGVPEAAVDIVKLLDRGLSSERWARTYMLTKIGERNFFEVYPEAADFYYAEIRKNPGALQVKKADIGDNTQPWRLEYLPEETQTRLRAKYAKALEALG